VTGVQTCALPISVGIKCFVKRTYDPLPSVPLKAVIRDYVEEDKDLEGFVRPAVRRRVNVKNNASTKPVDEFAPTQIILEGEGVKSSSTTLLNNIAEKKAESNKQFDDSSGTQKIEDEPVAVDVIPPVVQKLSKTSWSLVSESIKSPQRVE
jgi:hypothetical protein